jgi:transposase-like protein
MDQRLQFLSSYQKEEMSVADLCRAFGISRPTAYRWINRYNETGPEGLVDRSSRPHSCSHATLEPIENTILVLRAKHRPGRAQAQGEPGDATARRGLARSQYIRQHLESCGIDQSTEEKEAHNPMLRAVLSGYEAESAVVHGFQGLLCHRRRQALRSVHHHGCA